MVNLISVSTLVALQGEEKMRKMIFALVLSMILSSVSMVAAADVIMEAVTTKKNADRSSALRMAMAYLRSDLLTRAARIKDGNKPLPPKPYREQASGNVMKPYLLEEYIQKEYDEKTGIAKVRLVIPEKVLSDYLDQNVTVSEYMIVRMPAQ